MVEKRVPPIKPVLPQNASVSELEAPEFNDFEHKLLELSKSVKTLQQAELRQRIWLRWGAAALGVLVIVGMSLMLWHLMHHLLFFGLFIRVPASVAVVMFVAPVLSITTITVILFIAAFRRFEDKDFDSAGAGLTSGINTLKGL
jgi:hypothetical protein